MVKLTYNYCALKTRVSAGNIPEDRESIVKEEQLATAVSQHFTYWETQLLVACPSKVEKEIR